MIRFDRLLETIERETGRFLLFVVLAHRAVPCATHRTVSRSRGQPSPCPCYNIIKKPIKKTANTPIK